MKKLFLVLAASTGLGVAAQKNDGGKISFPKGQKLEMTAQTKAVITQEAALQSMSMDIIVNSTIIRSFDVKDVTNGIAKIEHKVKRLQFSFDVMGQTQSFDSDKPEDLKSEIGKSLEKSVKNKYTISVDEKGTIVNVKADDDNPNKEQENSGNNMMGNMTGQFTEGLEMPKAGDVISLKVATAGSLTKGQTWTDSLTGGETGTVKYTVSNVTSSEILIDYISEGNTKRKQSYEGIDMDVSLTSKVSGAITLDKKTGLLKQRTINSEGFGNMEVMGQKIPMKSKVTGTITVNGF
jgi:hypothetical protein